MPRATCGDVPTPSLRRPNEWQRMHTTAAPVTNAVKSPRARRCVRSYEARIQKILPKFCPSRPFVTAGNDVDCFGGQGCREQLVRGRESILLAEPEVQRSRTGIPSLYITPYSTFFVAFRKFARSPALKSGRLPYFLGENSAAEIGSEQAQAVEVAGKRGGVVERE